MRVLYHPQAEIDLDKIWDYTENHWGKKQAEVYIKKIRTVIHSLEQNSKLGFLYDNLGSPYMRLDAEKHSIFYKIDNDHISIIRILHQQMLPDRHLN